MVKRRGVLHARSERLKVPQVAEGAQDRRSRVGRSVAAASLALLLDETFADPRRDEEGGDAAAEAVELEGVLGAVGGFLGVGLVVGADGQRGRDVVVEAACFVEGDDEDCLLYTSDAADDLLAV